MNTTKKRNLQAKAAGGFITLRPTIKNKRAEVYYRRAVTAEIDRMLTAMIAEIKRAYETIPVQNAPLSPLERLTRLRRIMSRLQRQYGDKLDKNVKKIINKYISQAANDMYLSTKKQFQGIYGDKLDPIGLRFNSRKYGQMLKIISQRNALLIKASSTQLITNVTNITFDGVTTGQSWHRVEKDLQKQFHIAEDRIERIARDQTAKLNESLNEAAMRDAGVEYFEWMTAHDERVSTGYGGHKHLDGKIFKWGDNAHYPIIDTYGNRGVPAQRVNCRCTAIPVILQKDYEARQTSEGDWVITKGRL